MRSAVSAVIRRFPWTISFDAPGRNPDGDGQTVLGDSQRLQVFVHQYLSWMDRGHDRGLVHGILLSVIVDEFNVFGACVGPPEADPPLLVDSDAVRAGAIAFVIGEGPVNRAKWRWRRRSP
jgi:hypothetical protein